MLHDVDLEVADGSLTAILGPSGSGKTTLLRIIAGFERADSGTVRIGDVTVEGGDRYVPPERRRIGYVPQEGALFPHLTVLANVGFGLPRRERRGDEVRRLVKMVGLEGLESRYPHQLSGGQQQRVALARALTVQPQLVLLDEPFASLDASLRATVRADVVNILRAAGTTTVLVTHDQDEAFSMADRVAIIRAGHITPTATPRDFYAHPLDPDMATFVGEANLLTGTITGDRATTVLGDLPVRSLDPATRGPAAPDSGGGARAARADRRVHRHRQSGPRRRGARRHRSRGCGPARPRRALRLPRARRAVDDPARRPGRRRDDRRPRRRNPGVPAGCAGDPARPRIGARLAHAVSAGRVEGRIAMPTRGFLGRGARARDPRLPPGQYDAGREWPVLTAEATPKIDTATWSFTIEGEVESRRTWSWDEIHALAPSTYAGDIHCVTTWSKLGMTFTGVSLDTLFAAAVPRPTATHVLAFSHSGYTTNLPAGRRDGRQGVGRVGGRRAAAPAPARRARAAAGAAPLLLEERQVDRGPARARPRRARLLGAERLPRPRRPLARAAVPGRLTR